MVGRPPLVVPAHTRRGQRPESLDSLILIGQPQAEGKRGRRRRRRIDRVVQIRQSPVVLAKQLPDERVWCGHRGVNRRFPQGNGALTTRRHDSSLMNPQVVAKCGKRRRSPLVQVRQQRRVLDKVVQRLIVESGETSTEQRRAAIGKNRDDQLIRAPPHDERPRGSTRQTTTGSVH